MVDTVNFAADIPAPVPMVIDSNNDAERLQATKPSSSALLLLVDGRLPTGSYAHSGGIEVAVSDGRVTDMTTLHRYLRGRLHTTGLVEAALTAAVVLDLWPLDVLRNEAMARCASPVIRRASQTQGKGLLKASQKLWPNAAIADAIAVQSQAPLMWPLALGLVVRAAELSAHDGALVAAQSSVTGPAWAALRLIGFDPFELTSVLADLSIEIDEVARVAVSAVRAANSPCDLPSQGSPLQEIAAEHHGNWEVRLFVS